MLTVQDLIDKLEKVEDKTLPVVSFINPEGKGYNHIHKVREHFAHEDGYALEIQEIDSIKVVALWP